MLWDIFCKVIDNHGDIGVCWRLSAQMAARGDEVRLWVDDPSALTWLVPQGAVGVQVRHWDAATSLVEAGDAGDAVIEAFGCELPPSFQAELARKTTTQGRQPPWINLEYLTAEAFAERSHGLPSPVQAGPATGLVKHFFYPGFTAETGGLLREPDLAERQASFDKAAWLQSHAIQKAPDGRLASLFCYEPAALQLLLRQLAHGPQVTTLLVTSGRATRAVEAALHANDRDAGEWNVQARLSIVWLPLLSQVDFDHLLWSCDLNFVRGEDSLVRAIWAGKPFAWQLYPQDDEAHRAKLSAFLDWAGAPSSLRHFHDAWNGITCELPAIDLAAWSACALKAQERLLAQADLAQQLVDFVRGKRRPAA